MHAPARIWRGALPRACLFTEASLGQELDLQVGFESLVNIRMQRFVMSGRCGQLQDALTQRETGVQASDARSKGCERSQTIT